MYVYVYVCDISLFMTGQQKLSFTLTNILFRKESIISRIRYQLSV